MSFFSALTWDCSASGLMGPHGQCAYRNKLVEGQYCSGNSKQKEGLSHGERQLRGRARNQASGEWSRFLSDFKPWPEILIFQSLLSLPVFSEGTELAIATRGLGPEFPFGGHTTMKHVEGTPWPLKMAQ